MDRENLTLMRKWPKSRLEIEDGNEDKKKDMIKATFYAGRCLFL